MYTVDVEASNANPSGWKGAVAKRADKQNSF